MGNIHAAVACYELLVISCLSKFYLPVKVNLGDIVGLSNMPGVSKELQDSTPRIRT